MGTYGLKCVVELATTGDDVGGNCGLSRSTQPTRHSLDIPTVRASGVECTRQSYAALGPDGFQWYRPVTEGLRPSSWVNRRRNGSSRFSAGLTGDGMDPPVQALHVLHK